MTRDYRFAIRRHPHPTGPGHVWVIRDIYGRRISTHRTLADAKGATNPLEGGGA